MSSCANTQSRALRVKCPVDGELSPERKNVSFAMQDPHPAVSIMKMNFEPLYYPYSKTCFSRQGVFAL